MKYLLACFTICCLLLSGSYAFAGSGHYVSGVEGLRAATLPPPGKYWRVYNVFYTADRFNDNNGNKAPGDFNVDVYALVNRFIYSSEVEILGGNLLMDIVIPAINTDISLRGAGPYSFSDNKFGLGDICVEPFILSWHGDRYDAATAIGVYMPTGDFNKNRPASPGKGFWTLMLTAGGTVYFDDNKEWSASILSRYETHTEQDETDITKGDRFHFEWGVGRHFKNGFEAGIAGYAYWQVEDDSGPGSSNDREVAYAIGPEVGFVIPACIN